MILFLDFTDFDNVHLVFAGTRTKTTARSELVLPCAFSLPSLLLFTFVLSRFSRNLTDFFENFAENVYIPVHGGVSVPIIPDFVVESSCVSWCFRMLIMCSDLFLSVNLGFTFGLEAWCYSVGCSG